MENPKDQIANKVKDANNVLVTVSTNPSVDQLAATIGLTLFLTKIKKHATAVFSGQVPSTLEFLKPEETIEGNTDSLQDFIISLDKAKADKIRYKVEDQMVKIFITPYRSSIDEEDLVFSKGDFNVDVVIALGVQSKEDLDQAITAHGRILHDATVATINTKEQSELGSINWTDAQASSLCEMAVVLADQLKANSFDAQMATAMLTGIVAETERFSNDKTTSNTMNASAKLMAAGANQQLVATKLEETPLPPPSTPSTPVEEPAAEEGGTVGDDGSLSIHHEEDEKRPPKTKPQPEAEPTPKEPEPEEPKKPEEPPQEKEEEPHPEHPKKEEKEEKQPEAPSPVTPPPKKNEKPSPPPPEPPQIHISDQGEFQPLVPPKKEKHHVKPERREFLSEPPSSHDEDSVVGGPAGQSIPRQPGGSHFITEPPSMGGKLSAVADDFDSDTSPLSLPPVDAPLLSHDADKKEKEKRAEQKEVEKAAEEPTPSKAPEPAPPPEPAKPATPPPEEKKPEPPNLPQAVRESEESSDSQKAAEPPTPPSTPKAPAKPPYVTPPKAAPPATPAPKEEEGPKSKLPSSFIDVLDDSTLKELERRTSSPHSTQTADQMRDKTLENIEEFVHSPHQEKQLASPAESKEVKTQEKPAEKPPEPSAPKNPEPKVMPPQKEEPKKEEPLGLEYEAHESEPPAREEPKIKHHATSPIEPGAKPKAVEEKAAKPLHEPEPPKKEAQAVEEAGQSAFGQKPPAPVQPPPKPQEEQAPQEPPAEPAPSAPPPANADAARDAVTKAINTGGDGRTSLPPMERMGATDVDLSLHGDTSTPPAAAQTAQPSGEPTRHINIDQEGNVTFRPDPTSATQQNQNQPTAPPAPTSASPAPPPPGPPPIMPPQPATADQNAA